MFEKERILMIDEKRIILFLIFLSMFVLTEIGRNIYRPYIYANHIFDFWIADTIGNFTGSIAIIFFDLTIINLDYKNHKKGKLFILLISIGLIIYELVQYILPGKNTCDWRDIIATVIGGLISLGIYSLIYKKKVNKELQNEIQNSSPRSEN
jgi:VanZ family protein